MKVRIKICGITNREDAALALSLGADALGFIFAPSPRRIEPELARDIIGTMPPLVQSIGVFVNDAPDHIERVVALCGLDMVQLHGDEGPGVCEALFPMAIKAFQLRGESDLLRIPPYMPYVRALLFDTYSPSKRGGTGHTFDWKWAVKGKELGAPVILSGGLNPDNIEQAVSTVAPFGVDVNSGVEERPGKKSPLLLKELMQIMSRLNCGEFKND